MIQRFILALFVALTLVAVGCSEEEKKSSTSDTGSTSGNDGTSGVTSGSDGTSGTTSGSDGTSGTTTDDTSGSTSGNDGTSGTTAEDTGSTSGDTSGVTPTTDLCQNTPDLDYLAGTVADGKHSGKTGREAAAAAAGTCGLANLGKDDPKAETITCMQGAPENIALTDGCAGCYGDIVACSITNCLAGGCTAPGSPACVACQEEKGCIAAFDACTGPLPE